MEAGMVRFVSVTAMLLFVMSEGVQAQNPNSGNCNADCLSFGELLRAFEPGTKDEIFRDLLGPGIVNDEVQLFLNDPFTTSSSTGATGGSIGGAAGSLGLE